MFDNTPQIPEQVAERQQTDKEIVLTARPVPHYQELRKLARVNTSQDGFPDMRELAIESLPAFDKPTKKLRVLTASSQRMVHPDVEPSTTYDFRPLPTPEPSDQMPMEQIDVDYWQNEAFDPDSIINSNAPTTDNHTATNNHPATNNHTVGNNHTAGNGRLIQEPALEMDSQIEDVPTPQTGVPVILRAAPTFMGRNHNTSGSKSSSKATIRFIKPSFQREYVD